MSEYASFSRTKIRALKRLEQPRSEVFLYVNQREYRMALLENRRNAKHLSTPEVSLRQFRVVFRENNKIKITHKKNLRITTKQPLTVGGAINSHDSDPELTAC